MNTHKFETGFIGYSFKKGRTRGKNTLGISEDILKGMTQSQMIGIKSFCGWVFTRKSSGKLMFIRLRPNKQ